MSDSDENITHVFDQTNGVLDGFEGGADGSSESAAADAAARRDGGSGTGDRGVTGSTTTATDTGRAQGSGLRSGASDDLLPDRADDHDHGHAVDGRGTTTDLDGGGTEGAAERPAVHSGGAHAATSADTAPLDERPAADDRLGAAQVADGGGRSAGSADVDDGSVGHVFDQTNGVVDGVEGESDGTAAGDEASAADRGGLHEPNPVGQQDAFREDHYGAEDGRDPNR